MADLPYQNQVAQGGTGVSSLTAYAVLCGGTTATGDIQSIAGVGTAGQVLTSNGAGALPTLKDSANTCAFLVQPNGDKDDVTGDATTYTIVWDSEIFDVGNDFDGTSTFTAPVNGRYLLTVDIGAHDLTGADNESLTQIVTSNRSYNYRFNPGAYADTNGFAATAYSVIADMDASDTCTITYRVSGSTKTVDVGGSAGTDFSSFSGALLSLA